MKSLKQNLFQELQQKGVLMYDEAEQIARDLGYKSDNFTRRMRELTNAGLVEPVLTEKRHIKAYRIISKEKPAVEIMQFPQQAMKLQ